MDDGREGLGRMIAEWVEATRLGLNARVVEGGQVFIAHPGVVVLVAEKPGG